MTDITGESPEHWVVPPELDVPLPRPAKIRVSVKAAAYLFSFFFLAFCVLVFDAATSFYRFREELRDYGLPADGIVVELRDTHASRQSNIAYKFTARIDGAKTSDITKWSNISRDDWERLYIGARINVVYDPKNPHLSTINFNDELRTENPRREATFGAAIAISLILSVWGALALVARNACAKDKRLLQWGNVGPVFIVRSEPYRIRGGKSLRLYYAFTDACGKEVRSSQGGFPFNDLWSDGLDRSLPYFASPTVIFDSNNSSVNKLYPFPYSVLKK